MPLFVRTCASRGCDEGFETLRPDDRHCAACEFTAWAKRQPKRKRPPPGPVIIRGGTPLAHSEQLAKAQHDRGRHPKARNPLEGLL